MNDVALARQETLSALLRRSARRYGDSVALVCGHVSWTYRQLDTMADRACAGLARMGIQPGDRVAIMARNSHAFVALRFGAARLGAVLVPINFMLTATEVGYILSHSGARLLFIDHSTVTVGAAAAQGITTVEALVGLPAEGDDATPPGLLSFDAFLSDEHPAEPLLEPEHLAQIMYTSGTEAAPKGAMLSHRALLAEYASCLHVLEIAQQDRFLHAMPLFHCAQLDVFLGPCLAVGAMNILTARPAADNVVAQMQTHRATSFFAPPTIWLDMIGVADLRDRIPALRKGYYGASLMPVEVLLALRKTLPGIRLWNCYGQTEVAPLAAVLDPESHDDRPGSVGKPVLNVETLVVDDDDRPLPPGMIGEIVHRSPQLMSGYLADPQRTADAFRGGWFHSGDLGLWDEDGFLRVVDRKKDMIKSGGENVASSEVENAIFALDEVAEVAVIGLPDPRWIEAVVAVVVLRANASLDADAIIAHCRGSLAGFKVPKSVRFVDALPKNASGKIVKRNLRDSLIDAGSAPPAGCSRTA